MKKIIIALALGTMFGCSSTQTCVQVSPVAKRTTDGKHVYFLNNETGKMCFNHNKSGIWKDKPKIEFHLVDSLKFFSIPSAVSITNQTSNNTVLNR